jgi:hypothetical protein
VNDAVLSIQAVSDHLCLSCGLCCNGVIFRDVKLRAEDDAPKLKALGLPVSRRGAAKFSQPCAALEGCRCRIYADRPAYCRQFECALFKSVLGGRVKMAAALRLVRGARRQVEKVVRLLRSLGDSDEQAPLSARFHRTVRRLSGASQKPDEAKRFGRLTLSMHDLNLLLSETFYPGKVGDGSAKSRSRRIAGTAGKR